MPERDTDEQDRAYRPGVGVMLLNGLGQVFVAQRRNRAEAAWQMPQGGIEPGEDARQAALRELREEIGTDKAEFIEESQGWLKYDFPAELRRHAKHGEWAGQRQKWFVMRFVGDESDIDLETADPEFIAWRWAEVTELPSLVVSFKRQVYLDLLHEFGDVTRTTEQRIAAFMDDPLVQLAMAADNVDEKHLFELLSRASESVRRRRAQPARGSP